MDSFRKEWDENPREKAGYFALLFYTWTLKIFKRDRKQQFTTENIWAPYNAYRSQKLGDRLERIWLDQLDRRKSSKKSPSLLRAILFAFWQDILVMCLIHLTTCLAEVFLRPYLLGELISSFSRDTDIKDVITIAGQMLLLNFTCSIFYCHYLYSTANLGMEVRAAVVSTVFRKSLKLSKTALNDVSPGQIVNLVSNDVSRFEIVAISCCFLWSGPLQTVIAAYFLYQEVGISGFAGMLIIGGIAIFQTYTARLTSTFRRKIARETDQRIRLTDEVLAGIQVIKLYAWEKPFAKLLEKARRITVVATGGSDRRAPQQPTGGFLGASRAQTEKTKMAQAAHTRRIDGVECSSFFFRAALSALREGRRRKANRSTDGDQHGSRAP
ncbi:Multidrug resistance-associated protein [Nesidiocoris tenuis]|uniref:Multidrug resistance-associated protein n=1 Tax=Nesidiocoris tenuis TaxID=355587 RepID=A0ABN7A8Y6_9HEMI|nr:Multidrug resistance-associated protein [Nesidiocoris tenuis]